MPRPNNSQIAADNARRRFLTYDQSAIVAKSPVTFDDAYLYLSVLDQTCRIDRHTGHIEWSCNSGWSPGDDFNTTLTIFDYLCDAAPNRRPSGQLKSMASFGHMFHTGLLEDPSALERFIDRSPAAFTRACTLLGGTPFLNCDLGFTIPFFPDLSVTVQFWHSDEEFPPRLRFLWDSSANQYLRYETMYYALGLLRTRLETLMEEAVNCFQI